MHVLRTESDIEKAADPELRELIRRRIDETTEYVDHFSELVYFVIVEPGDAVDEVASVLGFSPLVNRFDGTTFGETDFTPSWEVLAEHDSWFELVYVLSDAGEGVTVFVGKTGGAASAEEGVSTELLSMCREFAASEADT